MPHNVAHFLAEQARLQSAQVAVRAPAGRDAAGDIRYTERSFAELETEPPPSRTTFMRKVSNAGHGFSLMVRPGLDLIRTVFALFKMGAVPIVIDPGMGLRRFLSCVQHARPEALIGIPAARVVAASPAAVSPG